MRCADCSRDLPSGFPGGTVTCACGKRTVLPAAPNGAPSGSSEPSSGGPYRSSSSITAAPVEITCPYCGNRCSGLLRVCPHCDVRFDSVRCACCYTLQPPGAFACARCGQALELEPLLDATDAPCPRCMTPLEAAGGAGRWEDARVHECPRCGGMFVPREALADILHRAELTGPFLEAPRRRVLALDEVKYLPCPLCHTSMNRINFGKLSGVIVDVCRAHGTWFDAGELTHVVAFAAGGGLAKTRAREAQEKKDQSKQAWAAHARVASMHLRTEAEERLEEWRFFLRELLFW